MRRSLVAGNWKMYGSLQSARVLLQGIEAASLAVEIAVFPPSPYLCLCREFKTPFGGQNCAEYAEGAYTGEVSASMLKDVGCQYVIIGHSERRQFFHETNEIVQRKCEQAFVAGLTPILCVGETLEQRDSNETLSVVKEQLAVVARLKDNCSAFSEIVVAYEPVWAIGTGKTASPTDAESVHAFIREQLCEMDAALGQSTRILYGGSVKPDNAKALFAMKNIDGALVGGASLNAESFLKIAAAAE
ncbi:MAG: triose-phosphate isomerase [Coxiellaceae bacterium]|nr:triose-phosphate isomerase [Coxiellaceae bacterium]